MLYRLGRSVNSQYVPVADSLGNCPGSRTRAAPYLKHPDARRQWQGVYDLGEPWQQFGGHRHQWRSTRSVITRSNAGLKTSGSAMWRK